jgi:DEAD/DEAH box helicase domain-containing protein
MELPDEVYYDIETQHSAEEVGGWSNTHLMQISIAVTWSRADFFKLWEESSAPQLIDYLSRHSSIISFNGDGFDSKVLSAYGNVAAMQLRSFDVLVDLSKRLGHRVSLDSVAQATLGTGKTADGLIALKWWKEGNIELIAEYCRKDVQVLMDIVRFGRENGFVKYSSKQSGVRSVSVNW